MVEDALIYANRETGLLEFASRHRLKHSCLLMHFTNSYT